MKILIAFFLMLYTLAADAQIINNKWISGSSVGDRHQVVLDFSINNPKVTLNTTNIDFLCQGLCPTILDKAGQIQFYSNGRLVMNRNGDLMENGDKFPPTFVGMEEGYPAFSGHPYLNNSFILPDFSNENIYFYFYLDALNGVDGSVFDLSRSSLYYMKIDMTKNDGLGAVVEKNVPVLLRDSLTGYATFTPIRHANGRDWWILTNELGSNIYHRLLFTPTGISKGYPIFTIDGPPPSNPQNADDVLGLEVSLDGTKFFVYSDHSNWIYDFNRCTGLLSNPIKLFEDYVDYHYMVECYISSNNRYVYVSNINYTSFISYLWRYDLWSSDPAASKELVIDHSTSSFSQVFELMHLPNGQMGLFNSNKKSFSSMLYPGEEEIVIDTDYVQHDFAPIYFDMVRINPTNYYLGPIDNSTCDTLGIDNNPLAHWRYDRRPNPFEIKYVDLTYYEPTYWQWDFGDGVESTEQHPVHLYEQAGIYDVCLIVGNEYSSDTLCKEVVIGDFLSVAIEASSVSGCTPVEVQYHANTVDANSMHWTFEGGTPSESDAADVTVIYNTAGEYTTELTATSSFGTKSDSHSVTIQAAPKSDYDFTVENLTITTTNISEHATSYLWSFGDGETDTAASPTHTYATPGTYKIQLIASNECGIDTFFRHLLITSTGEVNLSFGYEISPNPSDGLFNFELTQPLKAELSITIYNLLGQVVLRKHLKAGQRKIGLDMRGEAGGSYWYRLEFGGEIGIGKLVLER